MLKVPEEQLHVAVFELQRLGDLALVYPGSYERHEPFEPDIVERAPRRTSSR